MRIRRNPARVRARAGFTLIEILIAITILVIGVSGIIALYPSTIETASKVVEDTYAATIAQSVVDSIASAQRDGKIFPATNGGACRYLVFDHDGCHDAPPTDPTSPGSWYTSGTNWTNDHVILLPRSASATVNPTGEPILLYPCTPSGNCPAGTAMDRSSGAISGGATATDISPHSSGNTSTELKVTADGSLVPWIRRVYVLGVDAAGNLRAEYVPKDPSGNPIVGGVNADPYPQYSFALAIRRVAVDTDKNRAITSTDKYTDDLYEIRVMVFKNFKGDSTTQGNIFTGTPVPKSNVPVRELVTFIELGPGKSSATGGTGIQINGHNPNH